MKKKAIITLVKDVVIFGVAFAILYAIFTNESFMGAEVSSGLGKFLAYCVAGIPCGWRWASHLLTAISGKGILIKLVIAIILGWLAVPVMFIKDIINLIKSLKAPAETEIQE